MTEPAPPRLNLRCLTGEVATRRDVRIPLDRSQGTSLPAWLDPLDVRLTRWMARVGVPLLRVSPGIVFLWFGALKFFPGLSPAQNLAGRTVEELTFGLVRPGVSLPILAAWECLVGLGLIVGVGMRAGSRLGRARSGLGSRSRRGRSPSAPPVPSRPVPVW